MTSYYDLSDEQQKKMGVDYDFVACLEFNAQPSFTFEDVKKVLAVVEGEHDGADWHWVFSLNNGRFMYMRGGCDYTGWDCQSSASSVELTQKFPLKDAVQSLGKSWGSDDIESVYLKLAYQLKNGRNSTWREDKDIQFGIRGG